MQQGGFISITSRHSGEKHGYTVNVAHLLDLFIRYKLIPDKVLVNIADIVSEALTE